MLELQNKLRDINTQISKLAVERTKVIRQIGEAVRRFPNDTRVRYRNGRIYEICGVEVYDPTGNPYVFYRGKLVKKDGTLSDLWTLLYDETTFEAIPE